MLTDKSTGCGKRIVIPNQIDGICITMLPNQGNIAGNIHMRRAMGNAGHLLPDSLLASVLFNMAHILIPEKLHTLQNNIGSLITDSTVRRILNHFCQLHHIFKGLHIGFSVQNLPHHIFYLLQSVPAGHALSAGLASRTL